MKTFKITSLLFLFILSTLSIWSQNVMISNSSSPNEPSIKMNPLNTDFIVAGANLNNYYYSSDGGSSWDIGTLTSSAYGVWGDPVIDVDPDGNFYFFHLSNPASGNWIDRIVCQKSIDNGQSWNDG
ncbi:MAG: glycosyl hydrolase, partial [Flavobacteriaceae bacterium]